MCLLVNVLFGRIVIFVVEFVHVKEKLCKATFQDMFLVPTY